MEILVSLPPCLNPARAIWIERGKVRGRIKANPHTHYSMYDMYNYMITGLLLVVLLEELSH